MSDDPTEDDSRNGRTGSEATREPRDSPTDESRNERAATEGSREPLADLTEEIERRRQRRERDDPFDEAFEEMDAGSVDDAVWEELSQADAEPTAEPAESEVDRGDRDVRVVEKRSYCQRCRYFSEPPDVSCGHDGTEIVELVDVGHFRVADCPMVEEAKRLGDELDGESGSE